jgi:hypothetical protein
VVSSLLRDQIRRATMNFLTDTATISREVAAGGEFGEQVRHWDVVMDGVPCRLIKTAFDRNQTVGEVANRESAPELYSIILPLDAVTVEAQDQIEVGGRVYRVVQVQRTLTDAAFQRVQAVARD